MPLQPIFLRSLEDPDLQRFTPEVQHFREYCNQLLMEDYLNRATSLRLPGFPLTDRLKVILNLSLPVDEDIAEPEVQSCARIYQVNAPAFPNGEYCLGRPSGILYNSPAQRIVRQLPNPLLQYIKQMNENYGLMQGELMRARTLGPLLFSNRYVEVPSNFDSQARPVPTGSWQRRPPAEGYSRLFKTSPISQENSRNGCGKRNPSCRHCYLIERSKRLFKDARQRKQKPGPIKGANGIPVVDSGKNILQMRQEQPTFVDKCQKLTGKMFVGEPADSENLLTRQKDSVDTSYELFKSPNDTADHSKNHTTAPLFPLERDQIRVSQGPGKEEEQGLLHVKDSGLLSDVSLEDKDKDRESVPSREDNSQNKNSSCVKSDETEGEMQTRSPMLRSTVHTAYKPADLSRSSDSTRECDDFTIQLLRLAVLLYAPGLMPALNSLIARQSPQTAIPIPCFEGANELLTRVFRLLVDQQSIPNLPSVPDPQATNLNEAMAFPQNEAESSQRETNEEKVDAQKPESEETVLNLPENAATPKESGGILDIPEDYLFDSVSITRAMFGG